MKISVVIVTHNSARHIRKCLGSAFAQSFCPQEVIVVDNGSSDATATIIRNHYPGALLTENAANLGAAQARNQGIDRSCGEWVLTLDADACLREDFLSSFVCFLEKSKKDDPLGIVVPRILYPDARTTYALGHRLTLLRRFYDVGKGQRDEKRSRRTKEVFGACAATAFYRREMLDDLKSKDSSYFDESFFFMAEDVDLAWRARRRGWKVYVCHDCVSFHEGDGSGTPRRLKDFYSIRNRFLMIFKDDSLMRSILFFLPLALYEVLRFSYRLLKGEGGVYVSAVTSAVRMIKKRVL